MMYFATGAAAALLVASVNGQVSSAASAAASSVASGISAASSAASASVGSASMSASAAPTGMTAGNSTSAALFNGLTAIAQVQGIVNGMFMFTYTPNGVMVQASNLTGFTNSTLGKYNYHIHTNRVAEYDSSNNTVAASVARCNAALAHLDPLNVTENVVCSPTTPSLWQYCQTGDLSGKHGGINATTSGVAADFSYTDPYLRFFPQPFSLVGRSVVIHGFNKTRLGCGNIVAMVEGSTITTGYVQSYPTANPPNPFTAISLAVNGSINSAGLAAINYTLANPAPAANVTDIYLTTAAGKNSAAVTSYSYGSALPTQGNIPVGFRKRVQAL